MDLRPVDAGAVRHRGDTRIEVVGELNERPYVELTVEMMRDFGLEVGVGEDWRHFTVEPNQTAEAPG